MKLALLIVEGLSILIGLCGCDGASTGQPKNMVAVASVEAAFAEMAGGTTPAPGPDAPRCGGTRFITHGDGHKTPCPGCVDCQGKGDVATTDVYAAGKDSGETAKAAACPCGPNCKCREGWNDECQCPDCHCDAKGEKPAEVNDDAKSAAIQPGFVPVPDPFADEGTEGPGGFTGLLCIMDNGPCLHCVTQTATVASMPAWKDRIRIVHDGEQQAYGIGEVYGFPCWVAFIEGRAVRMHTGALSANEIADFNGNQPFGTAESEANRKSTARGWVWDGRESRWVWQMQRLQTPTMRNSYCPSCR